MVKAFVTCGEAELRALQMVRSRYATTNFNELGGLNFAWTPLVTPDMLLLGEDS